MTEKSVKGIKIKEGVAKIDYNYLRNLPFDGKFRGGVIKDRSELRTDRELLWHDEFEFLDTDKWAISGNEKRNWNKTWYCTDTDTLECKDSTLIMKCMKVNDKLKCPLLISKNGFRHGLIEVKFRQELFTSKIMGGVWSTTCPPTPHGKVVSWEGSAVRGEIDIAEPASWEPDFLEKNKMSHTVHYLNMNKQDTQTGKAYISTDDKWHIYGVEITRENKIQFYYDRQLWGVETDLSGLDYYNGVNVFNELGLYLILNYMMPQTESIENLADDFNTSCQIDWIRVYAPEGETNIPEATWMSILGEDGKEYKFEEDPTDNIFIPIISGIPKNGAFGFNHKYYPEDAVIMPRINGYRISKESVLLNGAARFWNYDKKPFRITVMTDIGDVSVDFIPEDSMPDQMKEYYAGILEKDNKASDGTPIVLDPNGKINIFGEVQNLTLIPMECIPDDQIPDDQKEMFRQFKANYAVKYFVEFTSPSTPTILTIVGAKNAFVPEPNKSYLLIITDGYVQVISS